MSLYYVKLTHSFICNKKNIIFLYFFAWYQSHGWFWSEPSPPADLLSRISSVDLLRWIFSVGSPPADLLSRISSSGSSQLDIFRRIFSGGSPPTDLLRRISSDGSPPEDLLLSRIFSYGSSLTVLNPITSTPSWNTLGVALPSASDRIKFTFITSLVHITYML